MGIAAPSSILHSTLTRMALKTWVILCLVLLSITLTLSSSHEENNSIVRKSRPRKGSDYEIESAKQKPRHGVGSKHGKKGRNGQKKGHEGNDYTRDDDMDMFPSMDANDYQDRDLFPSMEANDYNDDRDLFPSMEANDYNIDDRLFPSMEAK